MPFTNSPNPFNCPGHITQMEMYPQRRSTAFYRSPNPPAQIQSRQYEHASNRLTESVATSVNQLPRVSPPSTRSRREMRNSYFS